MARQVEIVLHVDESLDDSNREDLVCDLQERFGISHAHFTPHRPHLMVVDYDPAAVHALDVLTYIRQEKVHAELIGGI